MKVATLEVIRIHDDQIKPPGPKFVVCVEPHIGLFLRINTDGWRDGSVLIPHAGHLFLNHDSYIECGDPLELDDYVISRALADRGIRGAVSWSLAASICQAVMGSATISKADRLAICEALTRAAK